jgi:AraC-like DNA-binding protein
MNAAFKHCSTLYNIPIEKIRVNHLQAVLDLDLSHATLEHIKILFNQMFDYAAKYDYIKKNYASQIRVVDLAHSCGMSESYFRKVFEKYMNMKPMDYVNFVRIQRGCALLRETNLTVAMVSERIGYVSASTFIRNFKRIIGCTPNKWKADEEYTKSKFMKYHVTALKGWLE